MVLAISAAFFVAAVAWAFMPSDLFLSLARADSEGARPASTMPHSSAFLDSSWQKRWWIEKTARLLRNGEGLGPYDDVESLEKLNKEQIARDFMQDERFGDMVLDFNMYFLGFKVDSLKVDGQYVHSAHDFSNAIASAKALLENGDYLKLFDLKSDYYMAPLSVTPSEDPLPVEDAKLTPKQLRQKAAGELHGRFEDLLAMRRGANPIGLEDFCGEIEEVADQRDELTKRFFRAFTDTEIFVLVRAGLPEFAFNTLQTTLEKECEKPNEQSGIERLEETLTMLVAQLDRALEEISAFEPELYGPDTVAEFKALDHRAFPEQKKWPVFGFEQGTALANSSTNYNRKRAAYVLKRFFCDDLNPVGFDDPKQHVGGAHGSQTSCYSCHYKLDPMAGFFRNYGALFSDATSSPDIVFDDLASMSRQKYLSTWQAPAESGRLWDVGYIRSPRWTEKNSYGSSIGDLSKIIRNAPEAKRCLIRRLTEYMLGEKQTVDGGYLDELTLSFEKDAKENASVAFKNAVVRVLKSKTFETRNPDPEQCYDYAPQTKTENRPPCRIAYILEKNCVQCHGGSDGLNTLDLSKWIASSGGSGHSFEHLDSKGFRIPRRKTFQQIASRLSSSDPQFRMPKNKPMSSQERQELFLWVQKELSRREAN
jgi:hypothetical protein